ncbi:MAG: Cna B-type domain-containing protein, partial [Methanobrevibacter sp.]|uniref:Cna B-type domain-containing protein n=1 Tax=Methanobrevibacter sp. TaxID=66852 RepID=UPI001B3D6AE1
TVSVTNSTLGNYTLTNTHVPEVTSVNVTKIWNDSDNQDGLRPPVVTVELWNDTALVGTIELTNASGWKGNFTDLPVYSNGAKINYTVKEVKVANYTVSVTNSTLGNYTITNTHVPETTSINVTKVWNDMDDYDGIRPDNVTVVLLADDDEYGRIVLNDNTGWKGNFSDLPVYKDGKKITYSVKEIEISNYTSEITQVSNGTFVIKNTHNPICDLVISKYVNATKVFVNDTVEWNITLVNKGPSHAVGVVVNDTLPDGLKIVSSSVTAGRFDEKTRIWKIDALDVNHPVFLILVTQVVTNGTFTNVVVVNSTTPDSNETNNKANNTTEADPICDLEIKKLVSSKKAYVGEELTWTIIVINHGPSDAFDVKVQEDIPSSLRFISYTATKGKYDKNSQVWTIGKLESGSSVTLTIVTEVLSVGNITNPVEVNSSTPDSNKTNNKANNTTEASEICDLELVKSSDKKVYRVGDTMHWIIEVVNHGPCTAKGVWVSDVMPSGVKYIGYSASKGKYDKATGNWTIGNLAKGEKVTLDILCKVISPGLITNNANVTTSVNESDLTNNFDNATVKVVKNDEPVPPTPKPDVPVPEPIPEPENPVPQTTMHATGNPLAFLLVAIFAIFGAFWSRKEQE